MRRKRLPGIHWRKVDHSYHDILEFAIGIFVVATGLNIWEIVR